MASLATMDIVLDDEDDYLLDLPTAEPEDEELEESESEEELEFEEEQDEDLEEEESEEEDLEFEEEEEGQEGTSNYLQFDDMDVLHQLEPHPATNTGGRDREDDDPMAAAVAAALIKETESDGRGCPICLLDDDEDDRHMGAWKEMACGHRFHGRCVETWLRTKGSCPMCRRQLVTLPMLMPLYRHRRASIWT